MERLLEWGVDWVLWFQQFSPALDLPFKVFTFTGDEIFYLLLLPLIAWCVSMRFGIRLMILFLLNTYLNSVAKLIVDQPRPFEINAHVKKIVDAGGGGLPSGHTQNTLVVWSYLAICFRRKWLWILAAVMIIFVPMSRIYLGVHFPTDLMGGYVLGIVVLLLFIKLEQPVVDWLKQKSLGLHLSLSSLIPVLLAFMTPSTDSAGIAVAGTLMGGCVGFSIERRWIGYKIPDALWKKLVCYIIGIILLLVLYIGLRTAFAGLEPEPVFRFIRYSIAGLHFMFFGPWIFVKLNPKQA